MKNASYQNDIALPKIGTGPGDSKVDLRYRPESTGGIHHAVVQESYMRLGLCNSYMILHFVKDESYKNDTALPKIGTGPGDSNVDLRYRPEPAGGIHHAVMQESYMRLGLCNSYMILQFEKNASYQNDTALPKIGTGPGDSKLTFANGHNPLASFHHAVMHRGNHTCDSARASLIALTLFGG